MFHQTELCLAFLADIRAVPGKDDVILLVQQSGRQLVSVAAVAGEEDIGMVTVKEAELV